MVCQLCQMPVKNMKSLSSHIQFNHENEKKKYYDKFLRKLEEETCKNCGNLTEFQLLNIGYKSYCSKECEKEGRSILLLVSNPMKNEISKINQRKTNQKRYGVNQNTQRQEIKDKIKKTNLEKYGVDNVIKVKSIREKAKKSREETCLKKYGVKNYFQVPEIKQKIEKTCLRKYGVKHISQNPYIFFKQQKTAKTLHHYKDNLYYRGSFEKDFLDKFNDKFQIKQGLSFKYIINGKNRTYHSDFYIPNLNLIIEIKNSYLFEKYQESIRAKEFSVKESDYNYIIIIDKQYDDFISSWVF